MVQHKTRWFTVTNYKVDTDYDAIIAKGQIRWIAVGKEVCPSTGRPHHQCFIYMHNNKTKGALSCKKIGDMFGPPTAHTEPMRGSLAENEAYCSKEDSYETYGEKPAQGTRTDIQEVAQEIISGKRRADDILIEDTGFFHKYGRTLRELEAVIMRKKWRTEMTQGIWYCGVSGCGKSHKAFEGFNPDTHYVKNLSEDWWDGYKQQDIVILNEFRGQIKFAELLDLCDKWPKTVKWRNREPVPFISKTIIVACIKRPEDVYVNSAQDDEPWSQFERRFKVVELPHWQDIPGLLVREPEEVLAESRPTTSVASFFTEKGKNILSM